MLVRLLCVALLINSSLGWAQTRQPGDPWWFEIEAIFFHRLDSINQLTEKFNDDYAPLETQQAPSFLRDLLMPDVAALRKSLPGCFEDEHNDWPLQHTPALVLSGALLKGSLSEFESQLADQRDFALLTDLDDASESQNIDVVTLQSALSSEEMFNDLLNSADLSIADDQVILGPKIHDLFETTEQKNAVSLPTNLACQWQTELEYDINPTSYAQNNLIDLAQVPVVLDGADTPYSEQAYILPKVDLQLNDIYTQLRRGRDTRPMLHLAWRQNVVTGRESAPFYHIFAGSRLNSDESESNEKTTSEDTQTKDLVSIFRDVLERDNSEFNSTVEKQLKQQESKAQPDWQLDGLLRVFIEYIGGTPYLHVDGRFDYTDILNTQPDGLKTYRFEQLRRMISREIHYFDHPAFGMVIQIRRHNRPEPIEPAEITTEE